MNIVHDRNGGVGGFVMDDEPPRKTMKRFARAMGYRLTARPQRGPSRAVRGTRRVTGTAARRSSSQSPPGESDPPLGLAAPDDGVEQSRDSRLNRAWQHVLGLGLSPVELETLGIYCATRSVWEGRWAA